MYFIKYFIERYQKRHRSKVFDTLLKDHMAQRKNCNFHTTNQSANQISPHQVSYNQLDLATHCQQWYIICTMRVKFSVVENHVVENHVMGKTKKLPQRMLRLIVDEHNRGMGYRKISSKYNIHVSTIRTTIQRWKWYDVVTNLPRKGRPRKRDERAERLITRKIMQSHIQREQNFKGICRRLTPTLTKIQLVVPSIE